MLEFLIVILQMVLCAFIAHEGVKIGNERFPELHWSPNVSALVGFVFGFSGLLFLLLVGAIKVMVKRMIQK